MMALILCIGFVVRCHRHAENVVRHIDAAKNSRCRRRSWFERNRGSRCSMTSRSRPCSFHAVHGGILGRLFREFARDHLRGHSDSGLVSITLTPMLCSRFLKTRGEKRPGRLNRTAERGSNGMLHAYDGSLQWVLHHRPVMLVVFFVMLGATGYLFVKIPKGFIPDQDNDSMSVITEAAQGTSYYLMPSISSRCRK